MKFLAAAFLFIFSTSVFANESVCLVHEMKNGLVINDEQKIFSKDSPWELSTTDNFFSARVLFQDIPGAKGIGLTLKSGTTVTSAFFEEPTQQQPILMLVVDGRKGYVRCNLEK